MSLLAYIWQTIMRTTHFGGTFFRFFTFGTAIHKRNITGQNTKSAIHKRDTICRLSFILHYACI